MNLNRWHSELTKNSKDCYRVLVGSKCDLESERQVSQIEAQQWSDNNNIPMYLEVSAKNRTNIDKLSYEIASQFCDGDKGIANVIGLYL